MRILYFFAKASFRKAGVRARAHTRAQKARKRARFAKSARAAMQKEVVALSKEVKGPFLVHKSTRGKYSATDINQDK